MTQQAAIARCYPADPQAAEPERLREIADADGGVVEVGDRPLLRPGDELDRAIDLVGDETSVAVVRATKRRPAGSVRCVQEDC